MSTKRATLLTIKSFKSLSKVRSSNNSFDSITPISLVNNLSTAAERSYFQHLNGFNGENNNEDLQNLGESYSENQNQIDYQHRGTNGEFQKIPDGVYSENSVGVRQNPSGVYGINPRNEFQQNPVGQGGKFSNGYLGGNTRNEFQGNPSGYYREIPQNGNFNHYPAGQNGSFNGLGQNPSGYNTENVRPLQEGSDGFHGGNMSVQNPNWFNREGPREGHGNLNRFYQQSGMDSRGTVNGHYRESNRQFQESPSHSYAGNNEPSLHNPRNDYNGINQTSQQSSSNYNMGSNGLSQQNLSNYYSGNNQMSHQSSSNYGMQSTGIFQKTPSNYNTSNSGPYQQSPSGNGGVNVGSSDGYFRTNAGEYQQTPNGNYNANQQKSNEYQNGIVGPHVSTSFKPDGESVEAAENNLYSGTIEELDGFCKEGKLKEAVEVLKLLENQRTPLDLPRYFMLMNACGEAKAIQEAKYVHEHLMRWVSPLEVSSYNKILEMYGYCGSMDDAFTVFNKMPHKNLTSWDTMIISLVKNDLGEDAIDLFTQFKKTGLEPDGQMFIGVFSACSILGDISEGMLHFESMSKNYNIVPSMEHYVSVVDMMGSNGYLDEALEFIEKMPVEPTVDVWETLMNHCRVYGNTELGDRLAELVELVDPSRLNEQSKAGLIPVKPSDIAKEKEKKKMAAQNLLEVRSRVHEYRAGDTSHPEKDKIYTLLRGMKQQMKEVGYIPETRFVLHDIDQEGKEEALLAHSERLAVAHGLISSSARSQIRIIKNLRVCGDCHSALKIISKLVGRELIIRDAKRFHHFKDGLCSCRDYW